MCILYVPYMNAPPHTHMLSCTHARTRTRAHTHIQSKAKPTKLAWSYLLSGTPVHYSSAKSQCKQTLLWQVLTCRRLHHVSLVKDTHTTHTHTHAHTIHIYIYIHTHTHTCMYARVHAHIHTSTKVNSGVIDDPELLMGVPII